MSIRDILSIVRSKVSNIPTLARAVGLGAYKPIVPATGDDTVIASPYYYHSIHTIGSITITWTERGRLRQAKGC